MGTQINLRVIVAKMSKETELIAIDLQDFNL